VSVVRRVVITLAAVLAACGALDEYEGPINEKYAIPPTASTECVAAAKRASKWCIAKQTVNSDDTYSRSCNDAQWDYARHCR
jgi:hypothetical protein